MKQYNEGGIVITLFYNEFEMIMQEK